jgi:hypothetical protein
MNEYHFYFCQKKKATSQICYKNKKWDTRELGGINQYQSESEQKTTVSLRAYLLNPYEKPHIKGKKV